MLKDLIKQSKQTQKDISITLAVSQSLVSQWCIGKCEPKISQLKPLSKLLGVSLETLIACFEHQEVAA